ncbi:hypothetical protein JAAARDRAFT_211127 [Jaapia argillacea MUCL 33604]|uniref:G-protein coupled receptors family 2 profile 2 domain-containing protein n=1 Tax=Jaapia argillacea MUCL 33604 TaxID=933084 RepID=A0A067PK09_9AGAM|nr:hypothetical protein JAAARDRAFT_211127 [Jaapia argillacea MUCL 33604]
MTISTARDAFVWTPHDQTIVVWTAVAPAIAAVAAAIVVLTLAFLIWLNPGTRRSLQRQSLQMLLWVQGMSLIYSGTYLGEMLITGPTKWCNFVIIMTLFANNFINFVIMMIPVNLQLALVHGVRTEGWVRWYLIGSFLAALATALPGAIQNVWGWDPLALICWISLTNTAQRNAWEIGAFYAWIIFSMIVATVSTLVVIIHLMRYTRARDRKFGSVSNSTVSSSGAIVRSVAWRITLYPMVLIVNNCISAAANFSITIDNGINDYPTFVIWAMSGFLYGAVPMFYALVAIFVDPSFSRAVRDLIAGRVSNGSWSQSVEMSTRKPATTLQIELTQHVVTDLGDGNLYTYPTDSAPNTGASGKDFLSAGDLESSASIGQPFRHPDAVHLSDKDVFDGDHDGDHLRKAMGVMIEEPEDQRLGQTIGIGGRMPLSEVMQRRAQEGRSRLRAELNQL